MITTPDFHFEAGLTHGLVGPNGSGKTTLLRKIAGQQPGKGITVDGLDPFDNQEAMNQLVLMGIDNPLPQGWNLSKIFAVARARWPRWDHSQALELVDLFNLPVKNYTSLSRGQKSAAGFIIAIASRSPIVLLDEPYLGLDAVNRGHFLEVLQAEHGHRTIVVSTHHPDEVSGILDTVALLSDAPISGPVDDFLASIVQLQGPADQVQAALDRLEAPVLARESSMLETRAIVDARRANVEEVFDLAAHQGLKASEVTLQTAILALLDASGEANSQGNKGAQR